MKMVHIIDDQMYIRKLLQMGLQENGFLTRDFVSGTEYLMHAEEGFADTKPDIILVDIMMPDINGFELFERMKKFPEVKDAPVIFISARNQKEDVLKALKMGAKDFIVKPFDIESVIKKIVNILA